MNKRDLSRLAMQTVEADMQARSLRARRRNGNCEWEEKPSFDSDGCDPGVAPCWVRNDGEMCDVCKTKQALHVEYGTASKKASSLRRKMFRALQSRPAPAPKPEGGR